MIQRISDLRAEISAIRDASDRRISEAMLLLLTALEVGPDTDRLVSETGLSRDFVESLANQMREARLWQGERIDDREWWDQEGELKGPGILTHALVALGEIKRESTSTGAKYVNVRDGTIAHVWYHSPERT